MKSVEEQLSVLKRGVVPTVWADMEAPLRKKLEEGRPLRVKAGFDPTAPDLHLGHTVLMNKMRQFQQLGHDVIFLVGDFTALIGDPTGRSQTRPPLTQQQINENAETYKTQVFKVLDRDKTTISFNSKWLGELSFSDTIRLSAQYTVARMLERHDFSKRYQANQPISIHEFLYPLMQAYDSVALKADIELGGADQLFNLMVGRDIMKSYKMAPQVILTTDLLIGTDGRIEQGTLVGDKMSKSLGNYVAVDDPATGESGMFGKLMSISDDVMWHYYELLSPISAETLAARKAGHPKEAKQHLAFELTEIYHGTDAATAARQEFDKLHPASGGNRGVPDNVETVTLDVPEGSDLFVSKAMVDTQMVKSNAEARRLIKQGGVQIDGERVSDQSATLASGKKYLLKVGKRRFRYVVVA